MISLSTSANRAVLCTELTCVMCRLLQWSRMLFFVPAAASSACHLTRRGYHESRCDRGFSKNTGSQPDVQLGLWKQDV
ncbi:hypothetical protein ATANTOWER_005687 [Ataeniobius toweri]|uniref:Secreted protein n=1 Tax=Ataeniobius toweri TaxID=208326 RepID=A0ABU7AXA4_9TELE|nr:hypothetical protein [Ataeniobius toweri]